MQTAPVGLAWRSLSDNQASGALGREQLLSNRVLHLILMPTEQCQLRCTYCWQDFELGRMSPDVVRGIKNWISTRAPDLDLLALEWFGGEPLLAVDIIEEIQEHAREVVAEAERPELRAGITTNGVRLVRGCLERLVRLGVHRYQVTVDGPREVHDAARSYSDGRGSFDQVWGNLVAAGKSQSDFELELRINVSSHNLAEVPSFLVRCGEVFGDDPRFRIVLKALHKTLSSRDATLPFVDNADEAIAELSELALRAGLRLNQPYDGDGAKIACYAAAAGSFVVRSNGDLGKCTLALRGPRSRVGRLREDGRVEIDQEQMSGWLRGIFSGNDEELLCPAEGWNPRSSNDSVLPII